MYPIIHKVQNYFNIAVNNIEKARVSSSHLKACEKYRTKIERTKELVKLTKGAIRPIDNIDVGYLTAFIDPIQLAVSLLNPGGEVYIPAGTYESIGGAVLNDGRTNAISNLKLRGSGNSTVMKMTKTDSNPYQLLHFEDVDYCEISSIRFDGDGAAIYAAGNATEFDHAISALGTSTAVINIHDCWIEDMCGDGIYLQHESGGNLYSSIRNCYISIPNLDLGTSIGRNCIAITDGGRIQISNNTLIGGYPAGIDLETNDGSTNDIFDVTINDNHIYDSVGYGVSIHAQSAVGHPSTVSKIIVNSNIIENTTISGIQIWAPGTGGVSEVSNIKISDNIIKDCNDGSTASRYGSIEVNRAGGIDIKGNRISGSSVNGLFITGSDDKTKNISICDNTIYENDYAGINLYGTSGNEVSNVRIHGNSIYNNNYSGVYTYSGINASYVDYLDVDNLLAYDEQDTPTQVFGASFDYCDYLTLGKIKGSGNTSNIWQYKNGSELSICSDLKTFTFWYDDLAASQSDTSMKIGSDNPGSSRIEFPISCQLVALSISASEAVTAGTVTVKPFLEGVGQTGHPITLTTGTANTVVLGDTPLSITAGNYLGMIISSSADYAPDGTNDFRVTAWII